MRHKTLALAALSLVSATCSYAQTPPAPPIKMGLWQSTSVSTMTGLQLPPEVLEKLKAMGRPVPGAEPKTIESQSCLTPEKWKEMFTITQDRQNCTISNFHQSSRGMTGDITCTSSNGGAHGHMDMTFDSTEKIHGTIHTEVTTQRQPQPIVLNMTINSTYLGADCKGVSPDTPKIIMK